MATISIQPLTAGDREWVRRFVMEHWHAVTVVSRGVVHDPAALPGFVAVRDGGRVGLVTYHLAGTDCEIVTLDSTQPSRGIGTALIAAVITAARDARYRRVWLITTNDNLAALGFYQRRGFELVAVHRRALDASRRLKPEIPLIGAGGIPLRDEIELEMVLGQARP